MKVRKLSVSLDNPMRRDTLVIPTLTFINDRTLRVWGISLLCDHRVVYKQLTAGIVLVSKIFLFKLFPFTL